MTAIEEQVALYLDHLDRRVSRLETLEASGGGGGGGGDLFLIESKILTVQGIIQFTNIPSTAKHIFYTGSLSTDDGTNMALIINGSATATDISDLGNFICDSGGGGATNFGNVRMGVVHHTAGLGRTQDIYSGIWGWIPDVQDTSNHGGTMAFSGYFYRDDFAFGLWQGRGGGNWDRTMPVTQIDLVHDGAVPTQFDAGSKFSIYGLAA